MMNLSLNARRTLEDRYTVQNESPEDIFTRVAKAYATDIQHEFRLLHYMENNWFMPSSPILANGGTTRGLPISCYLNHVGDDRQAIGDHITETLWLSTMGGGCGTYFGDVRSKGQSTSRGTKTTGAMQFMHILNALKMASNQGDVRQGSIAEFMPIDHPEIVEFILMRKLEGDVHRKNQKLDHGVCVTDKFMLAFANDELWDLVDPHSKQVTETVRAAYLVELILETKASGHGKGEPYVVFIDRMNEHLHPDLKEQGFEIKGSNLCVEIALATKPDYTNVCCLSSVIVETFDEWKDDPLFIGDCIEFLDNVMTDFINNCPPALWRAKKAAEWERSIGLGQMGWHSFLQKNMLPMDSIAARGWNLTISKHIKEQAQKANERLAKERGPAKGLKKDRFAHMIAIAPNATTSVISNTSPSIEPWDSNYFVQDLVVGPVETKNKYLDKIIQDRYGDELDEAWHHVLTHEGSVQGLDKLSDLEREVFKTAYEIDNQVLIRLAADRQKYVCQSQSFNWFVPPNASREYVEELFWQSWAQGLKSIYYYRTKAKVNGSAISFKTNDDSCTFACSG